MPPPILLPSLLFLLLFVLPNLSSSDLISTLTFNQTYPVSIETSASVCVGLLKSQSGAGLTYTLGGAGPGQFPQSSNVDNYWLSTLYGTDTVSDVDVKSFVATSCIAKFHKVIKYSYEKQRDLLPQLVSLAIHFNAVPVAIEDDLGSGETVVFDATETWNGFTPAQSVDYVLDNYSETFAKDKLVKINPGYSYPDKKHPLNYTLTGVFQYGIVDFAIKEKIFTFFLPTGCVPFTTDHATHERVVSTFSSSPTLSTPITVYGYDNTVPIFGGDTYEAETNCVKEHNMGQVASYINNVGFYDRLGLADLPFVPEEREEVKFDDSKVYIALVVGDGDNFWHLKHSHYNLLEARKEKCASDPFACYPMSWTISPEAKRAMPDVANSLMGMLKDTGADDRIVLPPSGSLYSYPAMMSDKGQQEYIDSMEIDFQDYGSRVSVHWEWFYDWVHAFRTYFPKWAKKTNETRGFILTNVPYMFPVGWFGLKDDFKVIGDSVVLFRPNEWRYGSMQGSLSPQKMADKINDFDGGFISPVYMTKDGSLDVVNDSAAMVLMLNDNVEVVDIDTLLDLALQKHQGAKESPLSSPKVAKKVLIAQGGCDTDDSSCDLPPATSILSATLTDDTMTVTSSFDGIDEATWLAPYGDKGNFLATESGSNQVHSLTYNEDDDSFKHNFNLTVGDGPVFLAFANDDEFAISANYNSGSFSVMNLETKEVATYEHKGSGPNADRQASPHVHSVYTKEKDSSIFMIYALDLGVDKVVWYELPVEEADAQNKVVNGTGGPNEDYANYVETMKGCGPRHMVLQDTWGGGRVAHVLCELLNQVETFEVDMVTGALKAGFGYASTLPNKKIPEEGFSKAAELILSDDGKFLYATNRGTSASSNSIAVLPVDRHSGQVTWAQQHLSSAAAFPRGAMLDGNRLTIGGQDSANVCIFEVDTETGFVTETPLFNSEGGFGTPVMFLEV